MGFIANTVSLFAIMPIISLFVFYLILVKIIKRPKKAILFASDITTLFLIYSVYSLAIVIWGYSIGLWIFLLFIFIFLGVLYILWKIKEEVNFKKTLRIAWRFHFLIYFISHVCLFLFGMINRVVSGF